MNRLTEWKRRINATQLSDADKQKACDGLDRIWATGEGGLVADCAEFGGLFLWLETVEGSDLWLPVRDALRKYGLGNLRQDLKASAIQQLIDAAKRYKKLRDLAERAEKENYEYR